MGFYLKKIKKLHFQITGMIYKLTEYKMNNFTFNTRMNSFTIVLKIFKTFEKQI